jgi:hypothetical protein
MGKHSIAEMEGGVATERNQILEMLSQGKITVEDAERLLALVGMPRGAEETVGWRGRGGGRHLGGRGEMIGNRIREGTRDRVREDSDTSGRYLRILVEPVPGSSGSEWAQERVNVRVPLAILRAGMRLGAIIPTSVADKISEALAEKGIDLDLHNLKTVDTGHLIDILQDMEIDVQDVRHKMRIYIE